MKYLHILIFSLMLLGCAEARHEDKANKDNPQQVATESYGELPMLVEFSATWCGPCKIMKPIFEDLEMTYDNKMTFRNVDIDSESEMADFYHITAVPTFIFFNRDGKEVKRIEGVVDQNVLENQINSLIG